MSYSIKTRTKDNSKQLFAPSDGIILIQPKEEKRCLYYFNTNHFPLLDFSFSRMQVPLGQVHGDQAVTPAIMMVAPQAHNQTNNRAHCCSTKKAQIVLGSFQIILGILAIVFNVSIFPDVHRYCPHLRVCYQTTFHKVISFINRLWQSSSERNCHRYHMVFGVELL